MFGKDRWMSLVPSLPEGRDQLYLEIIAKPYQNIEHPYLCLPHAKACFS